MSETLCSHGLKPELCAECKAQSVLPIPPQVKYGLAILELEDGTVRRIPINPRGLQITMGMVHRLISSEQLDLQTELIAAKLKGMK